MRMSHFLGVFCLFVLSVPASAQPSGRRPPLPPDLAAIPGDALGYAHIRVADIWKSDALKELRETVMKAGEKALQGFDTRFVPTPSSIERLTLVVIPQDATLRREPGFVAILAVNKAIDKDNLLKSAMPQAVEQKTTNGSYYVDQKNGTAVVFLADQLLAFGPAEGVKLFIDGKGRGPGPLTDSLHEADSKRHLFAAVNLTLIPAEARKEVPPQFAALLDAKTATLAIDLKDNTTLDVNLLFADEKEAARGLASAKEAAKLGRDSIKKGRDEMLGQLLGDGKIAPLEKLPESAMMLLALGSLERADAFLADPPVKVDGKVVKASVAVPNLSYATVAPVAVGLLLPATQKVREAAARTQSMNNLKQIGIAMHNYHDTMGKLPPAAICDKNGKPLLSWRVAILPYIEQQNLYNQFKLDEPWDSENNKKASSMVVKTFMHPQSPDPNSGLTHYRIFYGKDAIFDLKDSKPFAQITDGLSNTWMVVEADEGTPWAKPDEFLYDAKKPLPKFNSFNKFGFNVLYGDGSVRFISNSVPEKSIRAAITANGGEVEVP